MTLKDGYHPFLFLQPLATGLFSSVVVRRCLESFEKVSSSEIFLQIVI